jgi:hypothetical protein
MSNNLLITLKLAVGIALIGMGISSHASDGKIRIDVNARESWQSHVSLNDITAGSLLEWQYPHGWPMSEQRWYVTFEGTEPLNEEWQRFEFSFTPNKSGECEFYARGSFTSDDTKTHWVAYKDFSAIGAELSNGDFSQITNGIPEGWLISPALVDASSKPPVIYGAFSDFGVKTLNITAGKKVKISFMAKKGVETDWNIKPVKVISHGDVTTSSKEKPPSCYWDYMLKSPLLSCKGVTGETVKKAAAVKNFQFGRHVPQAHFFSNPKAAGKGSTEKQNVPVELLEDYGVDRTASLRFGFPLPGGGLFNIKKIQVLNPAGKPVPFQSAATTFWPDKSLKWVLLQFDAPLKANEKAIYQVVFGENVDEAEKDVTLTMADNGDIISVDTGKLQATIDRKKFSLVKNLKVKRDEKWIDAGGFASEGLGLRDENGRLFSSAAIAPESFEIEEQGPERIVLKVRGKYGTADKGVTNMSYEVRLSFARGSEKIGIAVSTTNTNLDNEFTDIDSLSCAFVPASPIQGGKALLEAQELQVFRQGPCQTKEIVLHANTQTRLFQEDEQILSGAKGHENARLTGAVEVDTETGPVRAVLKDCWQRWPKAFSVTNKELVFELLPKQPSRNFGRNLPFYLMFPFCEGKYRLKWGVSFTENIDLDFGSMKSLTEADAEANLPAVAVIPRDWYFQTKVFRGPTPGEDKQFDFWDNAIAEDFKKAMDFVKNKQRAYGFLNYGDFFSMHVPSWMNNEYDLQHGLLMDFVRTGNRGHYRWAIKAAQHSADVDFLHSYPDKSLIGGNFIHSRGHCTGESIFAEGTKATNGHSWVRGLLDTWYLNGNPRMLETAYSHGEHIVWVVAPTFSKEDLKVYLRAGGYPLTSLCALFELSHDPLYKEAADKIAKVVMDTQRFDKGGAWLTNTFGQKDSNACYQVGIMTLAMIDYYLMTEDQNALKSIIASSGWLKKSFSKKPLGWPYVASWDGQTIGRPPNNVAIMILMATPIAYFALQTDDNESHDIAMQSLKGAKPVELAIASKIMVASECISYIYQWQQKHFQTKLEKAKK